jgi:hypothetical protein
MPKGVCALPPNMVDIRPVLRAMTLALDAWVKDGTAPPPSRYPRVDDGTLVAMERLAFPRVPGLELPAGPTPKERLDYGPEWSRGVISRVLPVAVAPAYTVLVPRVDADGNEVAGLRVPAVAVPTATLTGWALRAPEAGGGGTLCGLDGSSVPFARTKAERESRGDARLSLDERYGDQAGYVAKVRQAAAALERERYLLAEDVTRIVHEAMSHR